MPLHLLIIWLSPNSSDPIEKERKIDRKRERERGGEKKCIHLPQEEIIIITMGLVTKEAWRRRVVKIIRTRITIQAWILSALSFVPLLRLSRLSPFQPSRLSITPLAWEIALPWIRSELLVLRKRTVPAVIPGN